MAATTPMKLSKISQAGLLLYEQSCYQIQNATLDLRSSLLNIDKLYARATDNTQAQAKAKAANVYGDSTRFQNITVPIIEPQVENAVVYQASVFLTGNPIFGVVADPANEDAALQMQSVIEENSIRGGWIGQFLMYFRDIFKYNLGAVEVTWEDIVTAAVDTDLSFTGGIEGKPKNIIWSGNCIRRLDLYNTIFDTRVEPTEISTKGEFAGYVRRMSRIELRMFLDSLPYVLKENIKPAFESNLAGAGTNSTYYIPQIVPDPLIAESPIGLGTNWLNWAGLAIKGDNRIIYKDYYEVTTLYARIVPREFDIYAPAGGSPQIWKLTIVNHSVIVAAERQTNAHNLIPIFFGQAKKDGLRYQTKSLALNGEPFQSVATALMNSMIASRRRAISDRGLFDPSRVAAEHINSDNPAAKIPVRPRAYGKPLNEAYYPIPFRDDQAGIAMQEIKAVSDFSDALNGQNRSKQGQFTKGNRTLHEYEDVMAHSNGRDQMVSMDQETQVFTPIKEVLKTNILQYQAAGNIYSQSLGREIAVDPLKLRNTILTFKISDGILPTDKIISADDFAIAMQTIGTNPQIGAGYNLAPMFSYFMKTRNVQLKPFEKSPEQIAYEQAVAQWTQLATLAIEKSQPFNIPQPLPQQFNYIPGGNNVAGDNTQQSIPQGPAAANYSPN